MRIEDLLNSIDAVEFLSQYTDLKEENGEYWGISPLSNPPEKTPSFSVRKETGKFYCFSTGIGGSLITFLKYYHGISASEAIEMLKKYAGVDGEVFVPREKMAATIVCKQFSRPTHLQKTSKAVILPDNYMERYEKTDEKLSVWENEGISRASLDRFQVYYDSFSDRLVYPIRNMDGKIVNVGGRTLDPMWKEKKQRKYCYFHSWGTIETIYGVPENLEYIKQKKEVILFEGCKSVLLADTWGIRNTGAILTSHLSPSQLKILAKLGCRVVFALDKDVRVRDDHNIAKLKQFVNVEYLWDSGDLLDDKDAPVDKGIEVFQNLYEHRLKYR